MSQLATKPISATEKTFTEEVLSSNIPVVVDFWAPWCAPCRMVGPILDDLATRWAGQVKVVKINVDEEKSLAQTFKIQSIPTLLAMKGGEVLDVQVGAGGPEYLEQLFQKLSQDSPKTTTAS